MWNGHCFERSDILAHDLTLNLFHYPDDCPSIPPNTDSQLPFDQEVSNEADEFAEHSESTPHSGSRSKLIIVSSTGIFHHSVRWCHCAKSVDTYVQLLLRARLFPASFKNPKTAFTFEVLDHFLVDSLECKTAAMNFMSKIGRMTNEAFPSCVPICLSMYQMDFRLWLCIAGPLPWAASGIKRVAGSFQSHSGWRGSWSARYYHWWWSGTVLPCLSADGY